MKNRLRLNYTIEYSRVVVAGAPNRIPSPRLSSIKWMSQVLKCAIVWVGERNQFDSLTLFD